MKKTLLAIAISAVFVGSAFAQAPAQKIVTETATPVASTASTSAPTTAVDEKDRTNPFTGKKLSLEQIQRELEESRLRTQLLEEALKQTNLREEAATVPLRKAVEAAQARAGVKKEEVGAMALDAQLKATQTEATQARVKLSASQKAQARAEIEAKVRAENAQAQLRDQQPARLPTPKLLSVVTVGSNRSVVLDFEGSSLAAGEGENTPFGVVRIKDDSSAFVGERLLKVHSATLGRFVVSDPAPAPAQGQGQQVQRSSSSTAISASLEQQAGSANKVISLPPMKLPTSMGQNSASALPVPPSPPFPAR